MNKKQFKISVIMVTYNRIKYLKRALESILCQSFSNFELILVNNGSTDGTYNLCEEYVKKDSRIKFINIKENYGASRGRNTAINLASAEYITIVDDDDYCEKGMLEYLLNLADVYNADISMCGSYNDFGNRLEPYFIFDDLLVMNKVKGLDELLKRNKYNVAPPTKLFRKSLFEGLRFPEGVLVDDIHVIYKVFANANTLVAKGTPLYYFTKHKNNMTHFIQSKEFTPKLLNEYLFMYKERTKYLSQKVPEIAARAKYSEWSYMISMCNKIKKYETVGCEEFYNYMIKELKKDYDKILKSSFITKNEVNELKIFCEKN
ncbi:glycosyltransferase family 2 protein [Clostridium botulinum]|uniref:glycosyltransferase family 2 protein n=1 Tax=Clostridium botulinum TaxID=1491 RepID=UPI001A910074|nr:glycosyltransferase family 2 protein [Clostridium botulinum]MBO0523272.1 glycosyltransferase family 2 protein [Clostridium botulinum]MBO0529849.1 glycosyltransferase family 2 protein [Clostridium botulinum]MBO0531690.1 glycosyltransferase family 2 protein [Clostridium botulinum]MBO0537006.1 glycosyltransferase family 2 protein [Clostridium botulinum]MBO0538682.1 glycosyltransferase family 2 protein [Clostridium botulinum]